MIITIEKKIRFTTLFIICVLVVILHLMPKPSYDSAFGVFFNSYVVNIILPCYLFLLLTLNLYTLPPKIKQREMLIKILMAVMVFLISFTVETLQYFNINIFGSTFDVIDYLMYLSGVLLGLTIDYFIILISNKISPRVINKKMS